MKPTSWIGKILTTGPTDKQMKSICRNASIEIAYVKWIKDNPDATIPECWRQYARLRKETK